MEYKQRKNPLFSACGLNCGLCPRYYISGMSRCPGCAGEGFSDKHPPCGVLSCCQRKGLEYCFLCEEFPCKKYNGADLHDSFITHKNQFHDMNKAKEIGLEAYEDELNEKVSILEALLKDFDDGKRKGFFCLAVNLFELPEIKSIIDQLAKEMDSETPIKLKAAAAVSLFEELSLKKGIELRLRKK